MIIIFINFLGSLKSLLIFMLTGEMKRKKDKQQNSTNNELIYLVMLQIKFYLMIRKSTPSSLFIIFLPDALNQI